MSENSGVYFSRVLRAGLKQVSLGEHQVRTSQVLPNWLHQMVGVATWVYMCVQQMSGKVVAASAVVVMVMMSSVAGVSSGGISLLVATVRAATPR